MKPSSSTSEATAPGLFDGVLSRGPVRDAVGDRSWLRAMLDAESALARAEARAGLLAGSEAEAITRACEEGPFDIAALAEAAEKIGNPVEPLVRALTALIRGPAAGHVHRGATSQDVLDTAAMLVARHALDFLLVDLTASADAAASLASQHRGTLMAGRTLLQQALPITFGFKAALWLSGLDDAIVRLREVRRSRLAVQLGGAVGTLASLGSAGPAVLGYFAEELGLAAPLVPWHTNRSRIADLAGALAGAAGAIGKASYDVILLAQTEVAEVREGGNRGGSSTLPHKKNPIAAVSALANAKRAPALAASLLSAMVHEHERAAGAWHAEWRPFSELFVAVGSAASWLRDCLEHLEVDEEAMNTNLERTKGLLLAERITGALAPALGRLGAHDGVTAASARVATSGRSFADELAAEDSVRSHLTPQQIASLLDPEGYLGSASLFVERATHAHAALKKELP